MELIVLKQDARGQRDVAILSAPAKGNACQDVTRTFPLTVGELILRLMLIYDVMTAEEMYGRVEYL